MNEQQCEYCLKKYAKDEENCISCGGAIHVLEPWVLQCGWCKTSNRRDHTIYCNSCGGELPNIPGSGRSPKPPKPIRDINKNFKRDLFFNKNVAAKIGWAFIVIFFWSIIFPIIGVFLVRYARKKAKLKLRALEHGIATKGEIKSVLIDRSESSNGNHPLLVKYTFESLYGTIEGKTQSWDYSNLERLIGEHIWVVYDTENIKANNIWPPIV